MNRRRLLEAFVAFWSVMSTVSANERLNARELREVLVGNTEVGQYSYLGTSIPFVEFFRKDGTIKGKDVYEHYSGRYTIRNDGCFYVDYEGTESDGCYYYERLSGNRYRLYSPDLKSTVVTVVPGDANSLDGY